MRPNQPDPTEPDDLFRARLSQQIDRRHPLVRIDWEVFEARFGARSITRTSGATAVFVAGRRRGITPTIRRELRRRSAIEAMIGHMKLDGKLSRNHLKRALGDAVHALLCGTGHNLRLILRHLARLLGALLLVLAADAQTDDFTFQAV